jgi:hypothetical protein
MASTVTVDRSCTGVFLGPSVIRLFVFIMRIVNLNNPSYHDASKPAAILERSSLAEQGGVGYTSMPKRRGDYYA